MALGPNFPAEEDVQSRGRPDVPDRRRTVLDWQPPASDRHGGLSRRAFLLSTAACPVLLMTPVPVAAPLAAVAGERWEDGTFWDDGTGWI